MNTFTLMAEIVTEPELRRTPDNQNAIASFLVQFDGSRADESPYRLKVVGWNNLADNIMEQYHKGDRVVIEGRLRIESFDKGTYKEKRTELTAQRIHNLGSVNLSAGVASSTASSFSSSSGQATAQPSSTGSKPPSKAASKAAPSASVPIAAPPIDNEAQYDDIPF
ncbi:single-stranded DNA-binding protein [Tumidithrix elongata RA019]|uniref:Single-stranded DNA-binding protein n=1 Tax=Tumidithrix elongata BACA0141 TaxID=2716417 RepID=A0AAW9PVR9_9CYAN|nr:single-stranded DNA-binding protein [Tumidithrix elongata RA019]